MVTPDDWKKQTPTFLEEWNSNLGIKKISTDKITKNMGSSHLKTTNPRRKYDTVSENHEKQYIGESDSQTT